MPFINEDYSSVPGLPQQPITAPTESPAFIDTMNNWANVLNKALDATPPGVGQGPPASGGIAPPERRDWYAPNDNTPAYPALAPTPGIAPPANLLQYGQARINVPITQDQSQGSVYRQFGNGYRGEGVGNYTADYSQQMRDYANMLSQYKSKTGQDPDYSAMDEAWKRAMGRKLPGAEPQTNTDYLGTNPYDKATDYAKWNAWQIEHDAAIQRAKGAGYTYTPTGGTPSGQTGTGGIIAPTTAPTGTAASAEPNLWPFIAGDTLTFYENDLSMLPEDIRPYVDQVLRTLGYLPTGYYGNYGSKEYVRQPGSPRTILNDATISAIAGGDARKLAWLKWFMARKGLTGAQANYPGITAPTATG